MCTLLCRCQVADCKELPTFGLWDDDSGFFCTKHKRAGDVDIISHFNQLEQQSTVDIKSSHERPEVKAELGDDKGKHKAIRERKHPIEPFAFPEVVIGDKEMRDSKIFVVANETTMSPDALVGQGEKGSSGNRISDTRMTIPALSFGEIALGSIDDIGKKATNFGILYGDNRTGTSVNPLCGMVSRKSTEDGDAALQDTGTNAVGDYVRLRDKTQMARSTEGQAAKADKSKRTRRRHGPAKESGVEGKQAVQPQDSGEILKRSVRFVAKDKRLLHEAYRQPTDTVVVMQQEHDLTHVLLYEPPHPMC